MQSQTRPLPQRKPVIELLTDDELIETINEQIICGMVVQYLVHSHQFDFKVIENGTTKIFLSGFVKWDGCSHWQFEPVGHLAHFCTREELVEFGLLMAGIWDLAEQKVPYFSV